MRQKQKRVTEDEMVGWHHQFIGHELGQTLGNNEGQRSLACLSPWGHEESRTQLNDLQTHTTDTMETVRLVAVCRNQQSGY